jgi:para-nitrobenzyl esterase
MTSTVTTKYGKVSGQSRTGVTSFLGIPYAASPTGPRRFRAPEPPPPWIGVRPAREFSATPPKPDYAPPYDKLLPEPNFPGDDWLTVNVWTPDVAARLPVLVWIYGGGFSNGNAAVPVYDGHAFARDGVVLVTFNYRLGVDGFAVLPGAPANRGLLDQIAALEWVADNIAAFGGDPDNVTIFGGSAGAMSVVTLLSLSRARGLFAKAIAQSGAAQAAADPADAALVTKELGLVLGVEATAASLRDIDRARLCDAQAKVRDALAGNPDPARFGPSIVASSLAFIPVIDGDLIPAHPLAAIRAGSGSTGVPLLIGTNRDEFRLFLVPSGMSALVTDEVVAAYLSMLRAPAEVADRYRANRPGASPGDLLAAALTDGYFRLPALAVAEARAGRTAPTYLYEFAWPSPVDGLGAAHALEIPFVFGNLAVPGADRSLGPEPPAGLASEMHAAWIRFAAAGDPGWPRFDASYPVMTYDGQGSRVVRDPRGDERSSWSAGSTPD